MNRILPVIFLLLTCLALTAPAWAEPVPVEPQGSGTVGDPYLISTPAELYWISQSNTRWTAHYKQTADIDASDANTWAGGAGWSPIGTGWSADSFTGAYDGRFHTISGLFINRAANNIGLFGFARDTAVIGNLAPINADITGRQYTGALVGWNRDGPIISGCDRPAGFSSG